MAATTTASDGAATGRRVESVEYRLVLRCDSPVSHKRGNVGNRGVLACDEIMYRGELVRVPQISGNQMRNRMRAAIVDVFLGILGHPPLPPQAARFLYNGGVLKGEGGNDSVRLDEWRHLCEIIPSMRLFGGCTVNGIQRGTLRAGIALLICEESARYIGEAELAFAREELGGTLPSAGEHIVEVQEARTDCLNDPHVRRLLLSEDDQKKLEAKADDRERAKLTKDAALAKEAKSEMMPYVFEAVARGSLFWWTVDAITVDDLDRDTLMTVLGSFLVNPVVGGSKNHGYGKLKPVLINETSARSLEDRTEDARERMLGARVGSLFRKRVEERGGEALDVLRKIKA